MQDRQGWAFGDRGEWNGEPSRYLTIPGSRRGRVKLHATREEAEAAMGRHPMASSRHIKLVVAHVTEVPHGGVSSGYAFPITGAFESENT